MRMSCDRDTVSHSYSFGTSLQEELRPHECIHTNHHSEVRQQHLLVTRTECCRKIKEGVCSSINWIRSSITIAEVVSVSCLGLALDYAMSRILDSVRSACNLSLASFFYELA